MVFPSTACRQRASTIGVRLVAPVNAALITSTKVLELSITRPISFGYQPINERLLFGGAGQRERDALVPCRVDGKTVEMHFHIHDPRDPVVSRQTGQVANGRWLSANIS